jgi:hypothetical protein
MSDKMVAQFKTLDDLRAFANAQQKTLIELTKKNKNYEDELKHLKKLLESAVPVIASEQPKVNFSSNDEESIAREQLFLLKNISAERELTFEETRKVEIFSKILNTLKAKPKDVEVKSQQLTEKELLQLMVAPDNDG